MLGRIGSLFSSPCSRGVPRYILEPKHFNRTIILLYSKDRGGGRGGKETRENMGFAGVIFLVVPISTFCLGIWQYNRRDWKIKKIAELDYKVKKSQVQNLPTRLEDLSDPEMEYLRIKVRGHFDNSQEIFIGPRSLLDTSGGTSGGIISSGDKVGWHVITPFVVENGPTILINRGWVPRAKLDPVKRIDGQIQGNIDIIGINRHDEETSSLTPMNKIEGNSWFSRDIGALATKLNTEKVFLDLDAASGQYAESRGGPVAGQTRISLRNDHIQYMLTWFGISIATTLLWAKRFIL